MRQLIAQVKPCDNDMSHVLQHMRACFRWVTSSNDIWISSIPTARKVRIANGLYSALASTEELSDSFLDPFNADCILRGM